MSSVKGLVIAVEAIVLLALGLANILSGQLFGGAIVLGLAILAAACAWVLWPRGHESSAAGG
jgi:hypothetical protein